MADDEATTITGDPSGTSNVPDPIEALKSFGALSATNNYGLHEGGPEVRVSHWSGTHLSSNEREYIRDSDDWEIAYRTADYYVVAPTDD